MKQTAPLGKAPRIAYGEALLDLARTHRDIVALDADLSKSTMSCLIEEHFPERFFEMSIAEQNMMATAVLNVGTIKPMNAASITQYARQTGAVVTVEEHNICGGFGSAIAEALMPAKIPIVPVAVMDRFGQSAQTYDELLTEYGLTAGEISRATKEVLTLK